MTVTLHDGHDGDNWPTVTVLIRDLRRLNSLPVDILIQQYELQFEKYQKFAALSWDEKLSPDDRDYHGRSADQLQEFIVAMILVMRKTWKELCPEAQI